MTAAIAPLLQLLDTADAHGGLQTDDVLSLVLPLLREVSALHEQGKVAALGSAYAYRVDDTPALVLVQPEGAEPRQNREAIAPLEAPAASVLRVVGEHRVTLDADEGVSVENLALMADAAPDALPTRPVYLPGYTAWELRFAHHDALTDILCLGQVLASLSCGLDFSDSEALARFVANRGNLFALNRRLHPVVGAVIGEMTALDRHERARDLPSVIRRLETYRDQPLDLGLDRIAPAKDGAGQRRQAIRVHLRDRLFDLSRRNRLLHFKPSQTHVNLTVASVPLVVDIKNIRVDQLCIWDGRFASDIATCDPVPLARWLRFEDQPYLPGALDRILQEARRDRSEYGFSQLSLVIAFLRWHNLKEGEAERAERIASPLLMLSVELTRKKGVKDQYLLEAASSEAQVNPTLRHHLRQLYGIVLPETIDLRETTIEQFHAQLAAQIAASEPGVQLRLVKQPEIELIHQRARQRLEQFKRRTRVRHPGAQPVTAQDFSYAKDDFRPLGLQLFHTKVRPVPLTLRDAVGARPMPRAPQMASTAAQTEQQTYALHESSGNPYQWDVDLTSVTLGNFNHRKMSLVRDYSALSETEIASDAFDRVFSLQPRQVDAQTPAALPLADQWPVVQADATQTAAVALARTGTSYIIQGPPGTGKSQTITNLIADYVGRGQRVLFVCEKRAAIDVVFHRLRQQGLDELCCMIHDSQGDKKAFVQNLKKTYEHWLTAPEELDAETRERTQLVDTMDADLKALERFDAAMRESPEHLAVTVRTLMARLIALKPHDPALTPLQSEALPAFAAWRRHEDLVARLHLAVTESLDVPYLSAHAFAQLAPVLLRQERPLARLVELSDRAAEQIGPHRDALTDAWPPLGDAPTLWGDALAVVADARRVAALAARGHLSLLDTAHPTSLAFGEAMAQRRALQQVLNEALAAHRPLERQVLSGRHRSRARPGQGAAGLPAALAPAFVVAPVGRTQAPLRLRQACGAPATQPGARRTAGRAHRPRGRRQAGDADRGHLRLHRPRRFRATARRPAPRRWRRQQPARGLPRAPAHRARCEPQRRTAGRARRAHRRARCPVARPAGRPRRPAAGRARSAGPHAARAGRYPAHRAAPPAGTGRCRPGPGQGPAHPAARPRRHRIRRRARRPGARLPHRALAAALRQRRARAPCAAPCRRRAQAARPQRPHARRRGAPALSRPRAEKRAPREPARRRRQALQEELQRGPARARTRVRQDHALQGDPRTRLGRDRPGRARHEADLAHEPALGVRHAAARGRPLRRGDLRRGEPDPGGRSRARALPRAADHRGGRRDAAAADELFLVGPRPRGRHRLGRG
jgi:hypothetical protein